MRKERELDGTPLKDFEDPRRTASVRITVLARLLRARFDEMVADLGVTRSQWGALVAVAQDEGIAQRGIAQKLEISDASAGRIVDRLVAENLVERRRQEQDRRVQAIHMTKAGHDITRELDRIAARAEEAAWRDFDLDEMTTMIALLDRLHANLAPPVEGETKG